MSKTQIVPSPAFVPSPGRQVLYALLPDSAETLNRCRREHIEEIEAMVAAGVDVEERHKPRPFNYKAGDRIASMVAYVHEDGTCDLEAVCAVPHGTIIMCNVANAYGPGGYLFFNQIKYGSDGKEIDPTVIEAEPEPQPHEDDTGSVYDPKTDPMLDVEPDQDINPFDEKEPF